MPARPAPRRATVGHDSERKKSLARNPFRVHEYTFDEMRSGDRFRSRSSSSWKGLNGNEKVNTYYAENGAVRAHDPALRHLPDCKILPASLLTAPYNLIHEPPDSQH